MFADLAGSTALADRMDPESVRSVMDRYYAAIREVVERRRGRVVKFIGDGVMAVFGVPETAEGDAYHALACALEMHNAFADIATDVERDHGAALGLRVGVNTGEVIVSEGDDDVVGDAVNLAARFEHAAQSGCVLVGEATWRLTRGQAVFDDVRALTVAGKAEPVGAYRLVSLVDSVPEPRAEFVGRSSEMSALTAVLDDVCSARSARLATVVGSPGVGKTRLASEFEGSLDETATTLVVRCAQEAGAMLAPVAELLRAVTQVVEADPAGVRDAVAALVSDDEPDRDRIVSSAVAILGVGWSGTPEETQWAVRRVLEATARSRPVIVVIDDLQWAEPMMLDLVEHLAEWTRAPLMLLVLARPELRDVRPALVDSTRHRVIALAGLDREQAARLACDLLETDALPGGLLDRLPESTGGNPLFLRELLRMLVEDGILHLENAVWRLTRTPDDIDVPPTIQSLLASRLDRLRSEEQTLLERASIIGTEFPLGALRELLPSASRAADALLESLRKKELVEPDGSYWIDEPVYRFHHVLIRDAAYRRMLRQTRAELHERLARWLVAKVAARVGDHEELIGYHLEQGHAQRQELGPLDAHGIAVGREAGARLGAAATRALDREDLPAAAALAGRALACLPRDDPGRADVVIVHSEALLATGAAGAAGAAVDELQSLAGSSFRLTAWWACFACQLANLSDPSRLRETERRVAAVADELAGLGDARGAAKAHTVHASTLARLGRFADMEVALDLALTCAREVGDRRLATMALAAAPVAAVWGPSPVPRAGGRCFDVVRLLRIVAGSPEVEATSQRCRGLLEAFRGRSGAARRLVGAARVALEELGLSHGILEAELFAGIVEKIAGDDLDAAQEHLGVAYHGMLALGADADAARAGALLASVSFERGDIDESARWATEAERLAGDDLQSAIAWRGVRSRILAGEGRYDEALALAEEALTIAEGTDALLYHADACLALAFVRRAAGDEDGATRSALEAYELYDRKGATALAEPVRALIADPTLDTRPDDTPGVGVVRRSENMSTAAFRRWEQSFARRDWAAVAGAITDDYAYVDHRAVVGIEEIGPAAHVETMRILADQGAERIGMRILATRGERLALFEAGAQAADASEELFASVFLVVVSVASDARLSAVTVFGLDDLEGAIAELDARYLAGEGAPYRDIARLVVASHAAYNRRDWDGWRACCRISRRSTTAPPGGEPSPARTRRPTGCTPSST